jgi:hypothetical protein
MARQAGIGKAHSSGEWHRPERQGKLMRNPETRLHAAVVRYVRAICPECRIWHPANGGKRSKETARLMAALGVERGTPDLVLMGPDRVIGFIEVKVGDGKLTDEQDSFRMDCIRWGFAYCIARSLDDVRDFIIQNKIPNRLSEQAVRMVVA